MTCAAKTTIFLAAKWTWESESPPTSSLQYRIHNQDPPLQALESFETFDGHHLGSNFQRPTQTKRDGQPPMAAPKRATHTCIHDAVSELEGPYPQSDLQLFIIILCKDMCQCFIQHIYTEAIAYYIMYACRTSNIWSISSVAVHSHLTGPFGRASLTVNKTPINDRTFILTCISISLWRVKYFYNKQTTCWSPPLYFQKKITHFSSLPFFGGKIGLHPCLSLLLLQVDEWPWSQAMAFLQAAPSRALPGKMAIETCL